MNLARRIVPTALLLVVPAFAQERLFEAGDATIRRAVGDELAALQRGSGDLPATVALAALAGVPLPAGSFARAQLDRALRRANGDPDARGALDTLLDELATLAATLRFRPLVEAESPRGFPAFGAAVGEIELRSYPAYRMASAAARGGSGSAFWPLFRHIESNGIAMTAPVQMDWQAESRTPRATRMAFLYGDPATEPEHVARGVSVVDAPAHTALSIGAIGYDDRARVEAMQRRIRAWLATAGCEWEVAGDFRTMGYNSPMVPASRRYFEVQVPVQRRTAAAPR